MKFKYQYLNHIKVKLISIHVNSTKVLLTCFNISGQGDCNVYT